MPMHDVRPTVSGTQFQSLSMCADLALRVSGQDRLHGMGSAVASLTDASRPAACPRPDSGTVSPPVPSKSVRISSDAGLAAVALFGRLRRGRVGTSTHRHIV